MQPLTVADRLAATARMLVSLHARHAAATNDTLSGTVKRLQEAIADLTRLESKLRQQK
jgi:hypothetical protein